MTEMDYIPLKFINVMSPELRKELRIRQWILIPVAVVASVALFIACLGCLAALGL